MVRHKNCDGMRQDVNILFDDFINIDNEIMASVTNTDVQQSFDEEGKQNVLNFLFQCLYKHK